MSAKGKHRRPKSHPFSRRFFAASTGGAAIALPLIGATGAHAAQPAAPAAVPETAPAAHTAPAAFRAAPAGTEAASATQVSRTATTTVRTYSVVAGDYLAKIADEQHVQGGWQRLYEDNRQAVGADPGLIHPGLKLTIGAKATARSQSSAGLARSATPEKPAAPARPAESAKQSEPTRSSNSGGSAKTSASSGPATSSNTSGSADSSSQRSTAAFTLPVDGVGIGTPYRASGSNWSSGYHTGVDFVASSGTTVKAVGAGTVVTAGWGGAYGNQVVIRHDNGMYSQYAHLSQLSVSAGQTVSTGQQIGLSGATGNVTGPHLHFEIRTGPDYGSDVDPLAFLRQQGVSV
ncbi:LysM peptidoglycan-binding domain-containing M23 family metallopeptidase [Streptomyces sp. NPDC093085]|uniref:M23 family metallopeptidase n=1 Tax=Streptomyces sp. NPDC093085 TaxID=3155068 RepID=UPI003427CA01